MEKVQNQSPEFQHSYEIPGFLYVLFKKALRSYLTAQPSGISSRGAGLWYFSPI